MLRLNPHEEKAAQEIPLILQKPDGSIDWIGHLIQRSMLELYELTLNS
jgi:hypothetical protein